MRTARGLYSQRLGFTLGLVLSVLVGGVACEGTQRCWDDNSCGQLDAGTLQTGFGIEPAIGPSSSASADVSQGNGADGSVSPISSGSLGASAEPEVSAGPSSGAALDASAEPSSSDSAAVEPSATASSSVGPDTSVPVDSTSAASTSAPSSDPPDPVVECSGDGDCSAGVCVEGACTACDTANHHGCETASAGTRCVADNGVNRCAQCLSDDAPPAMTDACGMNNRGSEVLDCVNNAWQVLDCDDPDVCTDDDTDVSTTACGPNGAGRYLNRCVSGKWKADVNVCIDDDVCINDDRKSSMTQCGFSGYLEQLCVGGGWLTQGTCVECLRSFQIPDAAMRYTLSQKYFIYEDPVSPASLQFRTDIGDLSFGSILDLTGVQCFKAVTELSLARNPIADLSPISAMTWLTSLNLTNTGGSDLTPLSTLTNLKALYLSGSGVSSLNGLSTLTSLTALDASYNFIEDVSPLLPLTALEDVNLSGNYYLQCGSKAYSQLHSQVQTLYSDCP